MSLINQMLQELEQRKAEGNSSVAQVRAVRRPGGMGLPIPRILAAVAALAAVGGGYWLLSGQVGQVATKPVAPVAAVRAPATGVAPPVAQPVEPSVLQLAAELSDVPQAANAVAAIPPLRPEAQAKPAAPTPGAEQAEPQQAAKPAVKAEPSRRSEIDKDIKQLSTQQRAENAYRQAYNSLQQGRMSEAEDSLRQALRFDPRHAQARQALAALLVEMKRLAEAVQLLQDGLQLQPGNTGFAMTLARIQVETGDTAAALATLERNPPAGESAEYHGFVAALLQRIGRHKDAIEQFQAALRLNPDAGPWLLGLGISLQAENQTAKAADAFRRAKQNSGLTPDLRAFAEQRLKQLQ